MPHSVLVERITFLAKQKGISLKKLQRQLGISSRSIWSWDKSSPTLKSIIPIAKFFNVSLDYLCGLDESICISNYPLNTQKLFQLIYVNHFTDEQAKIVLDYLNVVINFPAIENQD